jgi:hypothetical protein
VVSVVIITVIHDFHVTGMNKSASHTPVQGPSTVVCMIVT